MKRNCKVCGNPFMAIKVTQFFCNRKCFKRDYYLRVKGRLQDIEDKRLFPLKECNFCLQKSRLAFDPMDNKKMYDSWGCPFCGATNTLIWEHQSNPNSYQIIRELLVSFQFSVMQTQPVYQTYQLPIHRLDQGNPSVITMPCDRLDISEIHQSRNKKKILFS